MFRKKLFLESVHKLGMSKLKEDAVISLFEATLDPEEVDPETAETPEGEDEPNTEGSAFTEEPKEDDPKKQEIKRMLDKVDTLLEPFRRVSVGTGHLGNTPNGTNLMVYLNHMLEGIGLGAEVHDMRQAMQMMSWEVIQFNKADDPMYEFMHPGHNSSAKKFNAITMIRKYMERIDSCLEKVREVVG